MIRWLAYDDLDGKTKYADVLKLLESPELMRSIPAPETYIRAVIDGREDNFLHVTDLFNSARYNFLVRTTETIENLDDAAWKILGTASHSALEAHGVRSEVPVEHEFSAGKVVGRIDLIENNRIVDYKVVGSYSMLKVFGMYQEDEVEISADGSPVLLKSGPNKGMPKTHKVYKTDRSKRDIRNYARQLNIYRYMLAKQTGFEAEQLYNFFIIRDGRTEIARSRGIMRSTYFVEMPVVRDPDKVLSLENFVNTKIAENACAEADPKICTTEECWDGRRCKDYCPVALQCMAYGDNPWLGQMDLERMVKERKDAEC